MPSTYAGFSLEGKVALVTGSARGIGRGVALALAEEGASVAVSDLPSMMEQAADTQAQIEKLGRTSRSDALDVTAIPTIAPTIARVVADFGKLDILVNNAGTGIVRPSLELTEADWDRIVDLNLKGLFFCAQAAAKEMSVRGGGRIINVASTHALIAVLNGAPYIASKGGVASLTRSLALDWIRYGINVNAIALGPVNTPLMLDFDAKAGRSAEDV